MARSYLYRECPEGRAAACRRVVVHQWEAGLGSPRGWLLYAGCGPPRPSSGGSHLGPGRKEQDSCDSWRSQTRSQASAFSRGQEGARSRLRYQLPHNLVPYVCVCMCVCVCLVVQLCLTLQSFGL